MRIDTPLGHTPPQRARGMTIVELLIAVGVGSLVLMVMAMAFATAGRSFAAMGNYVELDRTSRQALDLMSRDIRNSKNLVGFSPTRLVLNDGGTNQLVYEWNAASGVLTQWRTGDAQPSPLLTGCESLQFSMYKKMPTAGGSYPPTTLVSEAKSIGVAWKCSRTVFGRMVNTEDMQQAIIVIRNKPVL